MSRLLKALTICIFITDGAIGAEPPVLISLPDQTSGEPAHPAGKKWRLFATFHDSPRNLIIGTARVDHLLKDGYLVSQRPLEDLIKQRKPNSWGRQG
ncbi:MULTISPECIES: hypothetical protein [unclassified Devosia]|uniref:hypothetical protein n=1 Tax=unclassified Devosia TaxID=196773 RepID=UPI00086854E2|nr:MULTISPECIES: hypothetical protein [unclassified Devosia]MBN9364842.1 hypothetical protein [Devosia sp.]ODS97713.1 MAG: hypothetical protein ABS47_00475 [Devosia sp. SCN 66-27]OJX25686.1 MAG: hypothetical protein BGO83_12800 [Devosia sp. 66-14]